MTCTLMWTQIGKYTRYILTYNIIKFSDDNLKNTVYKY